MRPKIDNEHCQSPTELSEGVIGLGCVRCNPKETMLDEAFEHFADRTNTRIARRVTVLLEMALKIGGDIAENLEMIQKHVSEMQNIEKNRKSQLQIVG